MKFVTMTVFLLFFSLPLLAKDHWIQIVGIDKEETKLNIEVLYRTAKEFTDACTQKKRLCESYIDLNREYAADEVHLGLLVDLSANKNIKSGLSKKELLEKITTTISKAERGDQILVAIENHGSPASSKEPAKSCIYINTTECITEKDIEAILSNHPLKSGAKIAFVINGCYVGGFHDLMSESVCVATSSDQYYGMTAPTTTLWSEITKGNLKKFSDISKLTNLTEPMQRYRISEDIFTERSCLELREKISGISQLSNMFYTLESLYSNLIENHQNLCEPQSTPLKYIQDLYTSSQAIEKRMAEENIESFCTENPALNHLCLGLKKISTSLKERHQALLQAQAYQSTIEAREEFFKASEGLDSYATTKERQEFAQQLQFQFQSKTPAKHSSKLTTPEERTITQLVKKMKLSSDHLSEMDQKLITQIKSSPALNDSSIDRDIKTFMDCFIPNDPSKLAWKTDDPNNRFAAAHLRAKKKPKTIFTPQQIEQAQKCEKKFYF